MHFLGGLNREILGNVTVGKEEKHEAQIATEQTQNNISINNAKIILFVFPYKQARKQAINNKTNNSKNFFCFFSIFVLILDFVVCE